MPLVFIVASVFCFKGGQLFNGLLSSVAILFIYYVGLLLNRTVGGMGFLNYEQVAHFNGFESATTVAILLLFLFVFMVNLIFSRESLKKSLTLWNLANIYLCFFLVTAFVTSENLLVFLFACESFIWLNLYQLNSTGKNKKALYFQSSISTSLLMILTVFLGLLEKLSLFEMTYNIQNLSKINLSYVSGTIYSTQTLFFIMALAYIALKASFLLHILTLKLIEKNIAPLNFLLMVLGAPTIVYCFSSQQVHFYDLVCKEYGVYAIAFLVVSVMAFYIFHFQNQILFWSRKWTRVRSGQE